MDPETEPGLLHYRDGAAYLPPAAVLSWRSPRQIAMSAHTILVVPNARIRPMPLVFVSIDGTADDESTPRMSCYGKHPASFRDVLGSTAFPLQFMDANLFNGQAVTPATDFEGAHIGDEHI